MNLALSNRYPASGDVTVTGTVSDGRIDWDSHYTGVGAKPQEKDRATGIRCRLFLRWLNLPD